MKAVGDENVRFLVELFERCMRTNTSPNSSERDRIRRIVEDGCVYLRRSHSQVDAQVGPHAALTVIREVLPHISSCKEDIEIVPASKRRRTVTPAGQVRQLREFPVREANHIINRQLEQQQQHHHQHLQQQEDEEGDDEKTDNESGDDEVEDQDWTPINMNTEDEDDILDWQ